MPVSEVHCGKNTSNLLDFFGSVSNQLKEKKSSKKARATKLFPEPDYGKISFFQSCCYPAPHFAADCCFTPWFLLECDPGNAEGRSQSEAEEIRGR